MIEIITCNDIMKKLNEETKKESSLIKIIIIKIVIILLIFIAECKRRTRNDNRLINKLLNNDQEIVLI